MSVVDLYHVISAGGLQYDVVHVRLICCPAITVVEFRVNVTDVTGTVTVKLIVLLFEKNDLQDKDIPFQVQGTFTCILNNVSLEQEPL